MFCLFSLCFPLDWWGISECLISVAYTVLCSIFFFFLRKRLVSLVIFLYFYIPFIYHVLLILTLPYLSINEPQKYKQRNKRTNNKEKYRRSEPTNKQTNKQPQQQIHKKKIVNRRLLILPEIPRRLLRRRGIAFKLYLAICINLRRVAIVQPTTLYRGDSLNVAVILTFPLIIIPILSPLFICCPSLPRSYGLSVSIYPLRDHFALLT